MNRLTPAEEVFMMGMLQKTIDVLPMDMVFGLIGLCVARLETLGAWTPGIESKVIDQLIPDSEEGEELRQ